MPSAAIIKTITRTIRDTQFAYLHLELISSTTTSPSTSQPPPLDSITVRTHLTSALTRFLGDTGAAIPIDILQTESSPAGNTSEFDPAEEARHDLGIEGQHHRQGPQQPPRPSHGYSNGNSITSHGRCWIRVPREDQLAVSSALTSWSSWSPASTTAYPASISHVNSSSRSGAPARDAAAGSATGADWIEHVSLSWRILDQGPFLGLLVSARGGERSVWEY